MRIFIEASDVLFFRDGRPFDAGEGHRARSMFPPAPTVIAGALHSRLVMNGGNLFNLSEQERFESFKQSRLELRGPFIANHHSSNNLIMYFTLPRDMVFDKGSTEKLITLSPCRETRTVMCPPKLYPLWVRTTAKFEEAQGFINEEQLQAYLRSEAVENRTSKEELFDREPRFGITINYAKQVVEEGQLYQAEFIRFKPDSRFGLVVDVEGIALPQNGILQLGGDQKVARYQIFDALPARIDKRVIEAVARDKRFKIYLSTPAVFTNGWLPSFLQSTDADGFIVGERRGLRLRLIAAAVGRAESLGGWDLARQTHKPMRRVVPAGSVYYFEVIEGDVEKIATIFDNQSISDNDSDKALGFGLAFVGSWNWA